MLIFGGVWMPTCAALLDIPIGNLVKDKITMTDKICKKLSFQNVFVTVLAS